MQRCSQNLPTVNMRFRIPIIWAPTGKLVLLTALKNVGTDTSTQFDSLGLGGGSTLLAGISFFIGVPAPYLMYKYGERLRNASRHASDNK